MDLKILSDNLLSDYIKRVKESPLEKIDRIKKLGMPVDYFQFYNSVSSVYSSKIEGENIDFDSYFKHRFLKVKFRPDYTQRADDLYEAYGYIEKNKLTLHNVKKAHALLSEHLLPTSQQGVIRQNPMFVINNEDRIDYVAAAPAIVPVELDKLFGDIDRLRQLDLDAFEIFYYAAFIHLIFVKIHPFQDGNGRTARLIEKWFLLEQIGKKAAMVQLEKNYYKNLQAYYANIRMAGLEYVALDYSKCLDFLLMTVLGIDSQT